MRRDRGHVLLHFPVHVLYMYVHVLYRVNLRCWKDYQNSTFYSSVITFINSYFTLAMLNDATHFSESRAVVKRRIGTGLDKACLQVCLFRHFFIVLHSSSSISSHLVLFYLFHPHPHPITIPLTTLSPKTSIPSDIYLFVVVVVSLSHKYYPTSLRNQPLFPRSTPPLPLSLHRQDKSVRDFRVRVREPHFTFGFRFSEQLCYRYAILRTHKRTNK